jgi:hypothetical protein
MAGLEAVLRIATKDEAKQAFDAIKGQIAASTDSEIDSLRQSAKGH